MTPLKDAIERQRLVTFCLNMLWAAFMSVANLDWSKTLLRRRTGIERQPSKDMRERSYIWAYSILQRFVKWATRAGHQIRLINIVRPSFACIRQRNRDFKSSLYGGNWGTISTERPCWG